MYDFYFWRSWPSKHQIIIAIAFCLFIGTLGLYVYSQWFCLDMALGWEVKTEVAVVKQIIDSFEKGLFQFSVEAPNQYLIQTYVGAQYELQPWIMYLFLGCTAFLLTTASVAMIELKGLWYYLGLSLLGLFIYYLNLDLLAVFGFQNMYWPIAVFLSFGFSIHVIKEFIPHILLIVKYLYFIALSLSLAFVTIHFAQIENPAFHLAANGWYAPLGLALVYIFMIGTEIYHVFLYLTTSSKNAKPASSLINFLVITLIFIGNLTLTFLKNRHSIDWDMFYLEASVILIICAVLSFWSSQQKESVYRFAIDHSPALSVWHLAMAINCFICYSNVNISANDSLQEVMEDGVIFSQITLGIMFMLYVVANFWGFMGQNMPVHLVVYQPRYMPFGFVRIIALIGIFAIVMYNNGYQYRQLKAGYYSTIADVYYAEGNKTLTEEYLKTSLSYDPGCHKSNYSMSVFLSQNQPDDIMIKSFLKQAMFKNPSPHSYASLGNYFLADGDIIRSIETLREGIKVFPKSPEIHNNLALAFAKTNIKDSAYYYFSTARKLTSPNAKPVAAANELAFAIQNNIDLELEKVEKMTDLAYNANLLALANRQNVPRTLPVDINLGPILNQESVAYVVNASYHLAKDTTLLITAAWLDSLIKKNEFYAEELTQAKALMLYYTKHIAAGITTLDQLQANSSNRIPHLQTLSNWYMQQDAPQMAYEFLSQSSEAGDLNARFGLAIAGSFFLPSQEALRLWQDPILQADTAFRQIGLRIMSSKPNVYWLGIVPQKTNNQTSVVESFKLLPMSNDLNKARGRVMQHLNDYGRPDLTIALYNEDQKTTQTQWQYMRALKKTGQKDKVNLMSRDAILPEVNYLKAWSLEANNPKMAQRYYEKAMREAPLYSEGIVDAVSFLKDKNNPTIVYDLLLQSVLLNPYSIPLQKAYARQCVQMHLFGFADFTLEKLKAMLTKEAFSSFNNEIQKQKEEMNNNIDWK
jgi:hypothetical protein